MILIMLISIIFKIFLKMNKIESFFIFAIFSSVLDHLIKSTPLRHQFYV